MKPVFVIAEAGVNHNQNLDVAIDLVKAAAAAGADAVKFQTFKAENLAARSAERAPYQKQSGTSSQFDMLKELELPEEFYPALCEAADAHKIELMSTAYDAEGARFLADLGVRRHKIASADIVNRPLLEAVAATGLPTILSTGMATLEEIRRAVALFQDAGVSDLVLLHCVTNYPLDPADANLQWMDTLRDQFNPIPIGYSDHTPGIEVSLAAVAMGARTVEKHLTLDRASQGPDHAASLEPDELAALVRGIRNVEKAVSDTPFGVVEVEQANSQVMRRSLHAARTIAKGTVIAEDDVVVIRPNDGLDPWLIHEVIGKTAKQTVAAEHPITWQVV